MGQLRIMNESGHRMLGFEIPDDEVRGEFTKHITHGWLAFDRTAGKQIKRESEIGPDSDIVMAADARIG